jgi:hypothetical protein
VIPLGFFTNPGDRRAVDASANEQVHLSLFFNESRLNKFNSIAKKKRLLTKALASE